jgi:hypothetical protein
MISPKKKRRPAVVNKTRRTVSSGKRAVKDLKAKVAG